MQCVATPRAPPRRQAHWSPPPSPHRGVCACHVCSYYLHTQTHAYTHTLIAYTHTHTRAYTHKCMNTNKKRTIFVSLPLSAVSVHTHTNSLSLARARARALSRISKNRLRVTAAVGGVCACDVARGHSCRTLTYPPPPAGSLSLSLSLSLSHSLSLSLTHSLSLSLSAVVWVHSLKTNKKMQKLVPLAVVWWLVFSASKILVSQLATR